MKRVVIIICMGITILFLLSSCRKNEKAKTAELCRELENSVMLSPAFDSLVKVSAELPNFFRSKVLLTAGSCYSTRVEQMQQALTGGLPDCPAGREEFSGAGINPALRFFDFAR